MGSQWLVLRCTCNAALGLLGGAATSAAADAAPCRWLNELELDRAGELGAASALAARPELVRSCACELPLGPLPPAAAAAKADERELGQAPLDLPGACSSFREFSVRFEFELNESECE